MRKPCSAQRGEGWTVQRDFIITDEEKHQLLRFPELLLPSLYLSRIFNSHRKCSSLLGDIINRDSWAASLASLKPLSFVIMISWCWRATREFSTALWRVGVFASEWERLHLPSWLYEEFWAALLTMKLSSCCPGLSPQTSVHGRRLTTCLSVSLGIWRWLRYIALVLSGECVVVTGLEILSRWCLLNY